MTTTIEALTKDLQASKTRVDQILGQLEKEKARGRALYVQFTQMQMDLQAAFGAETPKVARKRKERTPTYALKAAAASLVRKFKKEGKTAIEAKPLVLTNLSGEARKELGLNTLPDAVIKHVDNLIAKRFPAPQK